ncbi:MAG: YHS domain-containing protein [Chloroflexi bacterium]|nr:YHS domain-containing protein [Chloroflexota bacterium]MDA1270072.1 YHS domain-containing protein [Chloroflexota bacterium]
MATAIDPICQMEVDTENPPGGQSEYAGATYYFCAPGCKVAFDKEPEKYAGGAESEGDDHGHGHDHGDHGHSHGHHMPENQPEMKPAAASRPGFFARLFGKK